MLKRKVLREVEETAERMSMEVIRQDPTAPQPFQTLQFYEVQ